MNLIDKLLKLDANKLALPTCDVEIPRLTELTGEPFNVKCRAIAGDKYADIQKMSIDMSSKGTVKNIKLYDLQVLTVLEGIIEPKLNDKDLLNHFNVVTPKELVNKLFLAGEIAELSKQINVLSGYDSNNQDDEEIKN